MHKMVFAVAAIVLVASSYGAIAKLGPDGLHKQPWFALTFRDIREDIAAAAKAGKRLAIIFEQKGCGYCKKVHEVLLTDPKIRDYIKANFMMVQYNMFGDEEVTDLDGKVISEKLAARRWGVVFTPTIMFMPEVAPKTGTAGKAAVARMPGAFGKGTFLHMFQWVKEKGYNSKEHFQKYHARKLMGDGKAK